MDKILYIGVDLHKTQFTICTLFDGTFSNEGLKFNTTKDGFESFEILISTLLRITNATKARLAIESTGNSRHFRAQMQDMGIEVIVVNTLRFKVVNQSTKKTDKNDARTLCEFLSKDMLPQSHLCSSRSEAIRRILKSRALLVSNATALKNQTHAVLLAYGIQSRVSQFQSRKERQRLLQELSDNVAQVIIPIFNTLDTLEGQRKKLEKDLEDITRQDNNVKLLLTIPGIGIVNACTIHAYIDDITRFPSFKHFSAYCGIVPWVQSSNESIHYGRITKHGPQELRTALVQCVVAMVRMKGRTQDYGIIRQYHELKEQKNSGKAIIATARKLSRIIYIMLTEQKPFDESRQIRQAI